MNSATGSKPFPDFGGALKPRAGLSVLPRYLLAPVPLFALQPIFTHIAGDVARSRPELFARLGPHLTKRYLIDPLELPFVLVLTPDAAHPQLTLRRRHERPVHDAAIAGTFFDLFEMIEGTLDGDALFFNRNLRITGDTEAVVALRNALDDFEGNVVDTILKGLGLFSGPATLAVSALRALRRARPS